jgi:hypothetical protein
MNTNLEIISASQWCQKQFNNYDNASEALSILNANPRDGILWTAKRNRAIRLLAQADIQANAAEFVRIITGAAPTGEIYIDVPGADIKARIKW